MTEIVDELRKLKQGLDSKLMGRHLRLTRRCHIPISPFTPNCNAAASGFAQDQRLGPADTPGFKDGETLPFQGVKGMTDFSPSQRLVGNLGSSR